MKKISVAVVLFLLVVVVIYAVANKHDIRIETPIASITSTAQEVTSHAVESAKAPVAEKSSEAPPTTYLLKELTSFKPQEKYFDDEVYLKVDDTIFTKGKKIRIGESISVQKSVKAGAVVSLWEKDGILQDGDDDFLGMVTVQGQGGVLKFENPALGDHSYELSFEPMQ